MPQALQTVCPTGRTAHRLTCIAAGGLSLLGGVLGFGGQSLVPNTGRGRRSLAHRLWRLGRFDRANQILPAASND